MDEQLVKKRQGRRLRLPGWSKILIAVVLTLAVSTTGWCLLLGRNGIALVEGWLLARFAFVDPQADLGEAAHQALNGLVDGLGDRWSYYLEGEDYVQTQQRRANHYVGIGVTVDPQQREEGLLVLSVTEGGPAQQAGVVAGDVITAVDGESIAGEGREQGSQRITGEEGTQVELTLLGEDGASRTVTCTRAALQTPSAAGELLEGEIGYLQLTNFYSGAADSFREEVAALLEQGARGLILDLRNNPGGYINELTSILDYLLPEGPVFQHNPRWGAATVYQSDADCVALPVVTLVNANTYSAAELLAAELKEFQDSPVVGERTSGKGYSQITFSLSNGGGLGLSTATYCTGQGNSLIGVGIVPDVELERSETEDNQLQVAIELLLEEVE
ncbi:MAG TPA: PDZ domain-containing protein [Firmicutes bacterium]|nr:PDZ domain-containing protein [Bacillota bacterium]